MAWRAIVLGPLPEHGPARPKALLGASMTNCLFDAVWPAVPLTLIRTRCAARACFSGIRSGQGVDVVTIDRRDGFQLQVPGMLDRPLIFCLENSPPTVWMIAWPFGVTNRNLAMLTFRSGEELGDDRRTFHGE